MLVGERYAWLYKVSDGIYTACVVYSIWITPLAFPEPNLKSTDEPCYNSWYRSTSS